MAFGPSLVFAVWAGVSAQLYVSPIQEVSTIKLLKAYFAVNALVLAFLIRTTSEEHFLHAVIDATVKLVALDSVFLATCTIVTFFRRLFLSPLSHIPGSTFARLSSISLAYDYYLGRAGKAHKALHKKYNSDFVVIAPDTISINCVESIDSVFKGKYARGHFYEISAINGDSNLNTTRDYNVHTPGRKVWEKAFTSGEVNGYSQRVEQHVSNFVDVLQKSNGSTINCTKVIDNMVFDIMRDVGFSQHGGLQDGTGDPSMMELLHKFMKVLATIGQLRNVAQLLKYLPETSEVQSYRIGCETMLADRRRAATPQKDICRHLLAEDPEVDCVFNETQLNSNANLIVIAGSDTTSSTLTQTFRQLCKNRQVLRRLQAEVDAAWAKDGTLGVAETRNLPYLNAVVNEGLRVCHPVPGGNPAVAPPEGLTIKGVFIPGYTQIWVTTLALLTDERYFLRGEDFWPERWLDEEPEGVKDRRAFIPFGYGVHSCVGKTLALNEMRVVIANVIKEFDLEFGEGYSDKKFDHDWQDNLGVSLGPLEMRFIRRGS